MEAILPTLALRVRAVELHDREKGGGGAVDTAPADAENVCEFAHALDRWQKFHHPGCLFGRHFTTLSRGASSAAASPSASVSSSASSKLCMSSALIDGSAVMPFSTPALPAVMTRQEEHTSELQTLIRISYAVFCLNKNT